MSNGDRRHLSDFVIDTLEAFIGCLSPSSVWIDLEWRGKSRLVVGIIWNVAHLDEQHDERKR